MLADLQSKFLFTNFVTDVARRHQTYLVKGHQRLSLLKPQHFTCHSKTWPPTAKPIKTVSCAAQITTNLLGDFRDSALLSHKLYSVASWRYAALCFAAALSSLAAFSVIGQAMADSAIQTGFTRPPSQLSFLDLHDGYSPEEAEALLKAWSPYGRRLYLLVEAIDCTVYHAGYRGFLVVVANRLAGALREKWPAAVHAPLALLAGELGPAAPVFRIILRLSLPAFMLRSRAAAAAEP